MNDTILISIISAGSALFGALIPTVITYLNNKEQNKFYLKRDLLNNQKDAYKQIMVALQDNINSDGAGFYDLQKAILLLSIYGDNNSSKAMNDYYTELVNVILQKRPSLTNEEHRKFQLDVINGIRKNLGLKDFEEFQIVGFRPQK